MRFLTVVLICLSLTPLNGQDSPTAKDTRHRLRLIATRASAYFQSAEAIDQSLRADGNTLHPTLIALRMRIEAALDDAQADLKDSKLTEANEQLDRAQAWVDRFARSFGGD